MGETGGPSVLGWDLGLLPAVPMMGTWTASLRPVDSWVPGTTGLGWVLGASANVSWWSFGFPTRGPAAAWRPQGRCDARTPGSLRWVWFQRRLRAQRAAWVERTCGGWRPGGRWGGVWDAPKHLAASPFAWGQAGTAAA